MKKPHEFSVYSDQTCRSCSNALKMNQALKGYHFCYPCFKIKTGHGTRINKRIVDGKSITIIVHWKDKVGKNS